MKTMLYIGALVVLLLSGCIGNIPETQAPEIHRNFSVEVVDSNKMPVENAEVYIVEYKDQFTPNSTIVKLITDSEGKAEIKNTWNTYLFSWGNVPGIDNDRLLWVLHNDFITEGEGLENATIIKIDDGNTIRVFSGEKSVEIQLNKDKKGAVLKTSSSPGLTSPLEIKQENGKLNIYMSAVYYSYFAEKRGFFPSVGDGGSSEDEIKVTAELGGPLEGPYLVYYLPQWIIKITPGQKATFPVELISHNGFEGFVKLSRDKGFPKEFQVGMESDGLWISKGETRTVDFYINVPQGYEFLSQTNTISGSILLNVNGTSTPNETVPIPVMLLFEQK
ncbi:MAG: hypothetical protein ABOK23_10610 [Candidatus Methanoperedens sp.]|nr:hypothetical protein [Candidatus Methanoperedens sp.]MCZ7394215.1 hypothetical protein [Candidatus Methanoperedens sp.]